MKTSNFQFLVLVPHRDARLPLRAWSASLFAAGFPGAWSFPWLAPLALLNRPLSSEELKHLAHELRFVLNNEDGKFIAGLPSLCTLPTIIFDGGTTSIYGPILATKLGDTFFGLAADAVSSRISPLVLGSALVHENEIEKTLKPSSQVIALPQISFRAAALANMSYDSLLPDYLQNGYSFEWKLGPLHWLPKNI
jgi:hypothetical protein